jgi:hypothetical protein
MASSLEYRNKYLLYRLYFEQQGIQINDDQIYVYLAAGIITIDQVQNFQQLLKNSSIKIQLYPDQIMIKAAILEAKADLDALNSSK